MEENQSLSFFSCLLLVTQLELESLRVLNKSDTGVSKTLRNQAEILAFQDASVSGMDRFASAARMSIKMQRVKQKLDSVLVSMQGLHMQIIIICNRLGCIHTVSPANVFRSTLLISKLSCMYIYCIVVVIKCFCCFRSHTAIPLAWNTCMSRVSSSAVCTESSDRHTNNFMLFICHFI